MPGEFAQGGEHWYVNNMRDRFLVDAISLWCVYYASLCVVSDVEGLKQFCQKHTLPPYHRLQVWNIILGETATYH